MVKAWCDANWLSFNIAKPKIVRLENLELQVREKNKYMGGQIDSSLQFELHIMALGSKLPLVYFAMRTTTFFLKMCKMVLRTKYGAHASLEITLHTKNHTPWSTKPIAPVLTLLYYFIRAIGLHT